MITSLDQLDMNGTYTYADYLTWKFDQFVELFKGKILPMSAPMRAHQKIVGNFFYAFNVFLKKQKCECELYVSPFDVRLPLNSRKKKDSEIYTVVQPDICLICDLSKLDDRGCIGAPDLIIEITSDSNSKRDVKDKFELYQENGVKEYWIARPSEKTVERFYLEKGKYAYKGTFTDDEIISPIVMPEMKIDLKEIFA